MTPTTLRLVGKTLYGPSWRAALAEALQVSPRTIRRWSTGEFPIPDSVADELSILCRTKGAELSSLAGDISPK
jgi:hypothetical protein